MSLEAWTVTPFKDSALQYAKRGLPVVPIHRVMDDGVCSCGREDCNSPGKHPITPNGFHDATTTVAAVEEWAERYPWANVAVPTGRHETFDVLDVDVKEDGTDGTEAIRELEAQHGRLDTTLVRTPRGGYHLLFAGGSLPLQGQNRLPGVDVRSVGGYVLVPPSVSPLGKYEPIQERILSTAPEWLVNALRSPVSAPQYVGNGVAPIHEGSRNGTLTSIGGSLNRKGLSPAAIEAALLEENRTRCVPPLRESEVRTIARSVSRYAQEAPIRPQVTTHSGPVIIPAATVTPRSVLWLVKHYVPRGALTILQGHGGIGKGSYTALIAAELSRGAYGSPGNSMFVVAEDGLETALVPRLTAAGADLDRVSILTWMRDGMPSEVILPDDVEDIKQVVQDSGVELLVIDPLLSHLSGAVDSYRDHAVKRALHSLARMAEDTDVAVIGVMHYKKNTDLGALYSGQASSAFVNTARCVLAMVEHDQDKDYRIVEVVKSNQGPKGIGRRLRMELKPLPGVEDPLPLIVDVGSADKTVDDILSKKEEDMW